MLLSTDDILILLNKSQGAALGIFSLDGTLLRANKLFRKQAYRRNKIRFINPTLDALLHHSKTGKIFEGYLTTEGANNNNESYMATAIKDSEKLIVFFETDTPNETRALHKLTELIQENSILNRQMTKEKLLEKEQLKTIIALNKEINQLLGLAAHDLRSPLGMAISFSELLQASPKIKDDPRLSSFLDIVTERCHFALNLIDDLLDVSKIEAGKVNLHTEEVDYIDFTERLVELHRTVAAKKNIVIIADFPAYPIVIKIDKRKGEQIINNLVSNAIKFSPVNSTITIRLSANDENVYTEINDQGPGIPENIVTGIFSSYGEMPNKPTASEKSTGLGLSIAKKLIEAHGGQVGVKNLTGGGASFFFTLHKNAHYYNDEPSR